MNLKNKRLYNNPVGVSRFTGLLLITPFIIGFVIFTLYPFISSFINGLAAADGSFSLENYTRLFQDSSVRKAAGVTIRYAAVLVPLKLIVSLLTALLLNLEIKGIGIFRTAFYIPSILGANLSVVIMWQYLFTADGLVNQFLELIGLSPVSWYGEAGTALSIIILLRLWEFGSTMVIFLAALRDIPKDYYDAASIDGCGRIRSFFKITLPLLKNVIFVNLILQTISALQEFNAPYMITGGNPMKETYTIGMLIYEEMFTYWNYGYANAVSWVMFTAIALIVLFMYAVTRKLREDSQ
ncbi:MAG: sugar ABC transporter permease [Ruminococcus sp.]|nr:sugar ABC transporter permease [Ruminococcus sp.]